MNFGATGSNFLFEFKDLPLDGFGNVTLSAADFAGCFIAAVIPMNAALELYNGGAAILLTTGAVAAGCTYTDWQQIADNGGGGFVFLEVAARGANVTSFVFTGNAALTYDLLNPFSITGVRVFFVRWI